MWDEVFIKKGILEVRRERKSEVSSESEKVYCGKMMILPAGFYICAKVYFILFLCLCHKFKVSSDSIVQFSSVTQSCPTLCDPMNHSTPGLSVHHQLPESTQTHVHWVSDAIQLYHPLSSPFAALNLSQHQGLFKWISSSHQVAKVLEFQLQHQSFQWTPRTDLQDGLVRSPCSPRDSQESSPTPQFKSISSSTAFLMMYFAYKLNNQPWHTPFPFWNQSVVPCPVLTVASWSAFQLSL